MSIARDRHRHLRVVVYRTAKSKHLTSIINARIQLNYHRSADNLFEKIAWSLLSTHDVGVYSQVPIRYRQRNNLKKKTFPK